MPDIAKLVIRPLTAGLAVLTIAAAALPAKADPTEVNLNDETTIGGIGVACTGVGQSRDQPQWRTYPVKLVFADPKGLLLADVTVSVTDAKGAQVLQMHCGGPWVLMKLPAGKSFKVEARLSQPGTAPRTNSVRAPAHGQATVVFTFPDAKA
jgi:hypothetical protein